MEASQKSVNSLFVHCRKQELNLDILNLRYADNEESIQTYLS